MTAFAFTSEQSISRATRLLNYSASTTLAQSPAITALLSTKDSSSPSPTTLIWRIFPILPRRKSSESNGFYIDNAGTNHGFLDINGTFTTVDFPGTTLNQLLGLNNLEQAAGYYADAAGIDHPYIFDHNGGVFLVITIPAAVGGAQATGINDNGSISGFYIDSKGTNHGFVIAKGRFQTLDFPGSTLTQAFGLNNHDEVVGQYVDASGLTHGFIFDDGRFTSVDDPEGVGTTTINGINDRRQIVGFFVTAGGNTNGFVGSE